MPNLANKKDISICPLSGATKPINQIELAESEHDTCPHFSAILEILTNVNLSPEYRLARLQLMIETLKEGLNQISQTDA